MDNPFKGHQVGNCNRFTSTHYSANAFAVTGAQEQAHCASKIVSNSYLFHSKSADIPIPIIRLLKMCPRQSEIKIMGEVKVDSHNLGPLFYRLTSFWFHVNPPSYSYDRAFFNLTYKMKGQRYSSRSHSKYNILSAHIPFVPCLSSLPFLRYSYFKNWPWKSEVNVMGEVTVQSDNVGLTFYRLTSVSFHVNRPSHSWFTAFSKFDLENPRSRSWVRSQFNVTMRV